MAGKDLANPKLALERKKKPVSAANSKKKIAPPVVVTPVKPPVPPLPYYPTYDFITGIDFSAWSGDVDWYQLADNPDIQFVYFRSSFGYTRDYRYEKNMKGALEIFKKPFGTYSFFLPATRDYKRQCDLAHELARGSILPYWWDVEDSQGLFKQDFGNVTEKYVKYDADKYGKMPIVYTNLDTWDYHMPRTNWAKYCGLAIAAWSDIATLPMIPQDWILKRSTVMECRKKAWTFWQWSKGGRVDGINASVDLIRAERKKFIDLLQGTPFEGMYAEPEKV